MRTEMIMRGKLVASVMRKTSKDRVYNVRQFINQTKEGLMMPLNVKDYSEDQMTVGKEYEFEFFPNAFMNRGIPNIELVKVEKAKIISNGSAKV